MSIVSENYGQRPSPALKQFRNNLLNGPVNASESRKGLQPCESATMCCRSGANADSYLKSGAVKGKDAASYSAAARLRARLPTAVSHRESEGAFRSRRGRRRGPFVDSPYWDERGCSSRHD